MNKKYSRKRTTKGRRLLQVTKLPNVRKVAVAPTGAQSVLKTMDMRQTPLVHKAPRTGHSSMPADTAHVETLPEKKAAPSVETQRSTGGRVGGKAPRKKKERTRIFAPGYLDKHTEITNIHNTNLTSRIIERPSSNPQLDPIYMDYVVEQVGSTTQLDKYKKMYPRVVIPIPAYGDVPQTVGGDDPTTSGQLLKGETFCGFNRANVHWPTAYYDHCLTSINVNNNLAACRSLFNRSQIYLLLKDMWTRATSQSPTPATSFEDWWQALSEVPSGEQSYGLPVDEIECIFEYQNRSTSVDMNMSIYMCTPKRILKANQTPMQTWFDPWTNGTNVTENNWSMLMNPDYRYNPILQAEPEVMGTSDNAGVGTNSTNPNTNPIRIFETRASVQTASTEVCLDATPFLSEEFKRNWRVITVHKVKLMPQQSLFYKMKLDFSKILNMKEFFSDGADGNREHPFFFPDMTVFPMIKYYGSEVTGESKSLRQDPTGPIGPYLYRNLAQESTGPGTAPCCLSVGMECKAIVHQKSYPLYQPYTSGNLLPQRDWIELLMDNFTAKSRELFRFDSIQRGVNTPYYRINQNMTDFYNKPSWLNPGTQLEYATAMVELDTHNGIVPSTSSPSSTICRWGENEDMDWTTIDTISRSRIVQTQSDINPN